MWRNNMMTWRPYLDSVWRHFRDCFIFQPDIFYRFYRSVKGDIYILKSSSPGSLTTIEGVIGWLGSNVNALNTNNIRKHSSLIFLQQHFTTVSLLGKTIYAASEKRNELEKLICRNRRRRASVRKKFF